MPASPKTQYAETPDGVHIAYQVVGDGPIDLVFSMGRATQLEMLWDEPRCARFFERLASFSRLVLHDRRGIGLSDRGLPISSFAEQVDDLNAVLAAVGAETVCHFSCHLGGRLSLVFAATYPERTRAIVLFGSHPTTLKDDDYPWGTTLADNESLAKEYESSWGDDEYSGQYLRRLAPSVANDEGVRRWFGRFTRAALSRAEVARLTRNLRDIDIRYVLDTIRVPTLVLHRIGDRIARIEASRYMAERIRGARLEELPGDDHLPMFGDADGLLDEVQAFLTGARPARPSDRILATVLFTDIVGSTHKAAELGDRRWRDLLDRHNQDVRATLGRFGGTEINTTGDGFLVLFDSPTRAIHCARALVTETPKLGIELRAGVHTGECERMGTDVTGIAVNIAARVSVLAGPGELLISRTVQDLVTGSGIEFEDRGEHELKGVPGSWRLYAVIG